MRIDETIHQAIAAGTLTIAEAVAAYGRAQPALERAVIEMVEAEIIARGFRAEDARWVVENQARVLRESRAARLETARQMLEAGARSLQ